MIERAPKTDQVKLPEILEGGQVAEVAQKIFESTDFEIGKQFVEPNVILAMAGLKPATEISVMLEGEMDLTHFSAELQKVIPLLDPLEATTVQVVGPMTHGFKQKPMAMSGIVSLRGAERIAKSSKFKGMPDFLATSGVEGLQRWTNEVWQWLKTAQASGSIPENYNIQLIYEGLWLGYPDQAIWDFADALAKGDQSKLVDSHQEIPDMQRHHHGASPSYNYYPEHAQDPAIVENIAATSRLLKEFYASPAYQTIMADPRWKEA